MKPDQHSRDQLTETHNEFKRPTSILLFTPCTFELVVDVYKYDMIPTRAIMEHS